MNGKRAKALRATATSRKAYRKLKAEYKGQAVSAAQCPKFAKAHKPAEWNYTLPTWPATANQKAQSRPLIVMHPVRRRLETVRSAAAKGILRRTSHGVPKHLIDAWSLS